MQNSLNPQVELDNDLSKTRQNSTFKLILPKGWQDNTVHCFVGPEARGQQHLLTVSVDDNSDTNDPAEYAAVRRDQLLDNMVGAEVLKDEPKELESGYPAHEIVYKISAMAGKPTFRKQVFIIADKKAYTFSADFTKQTIKTIGLMVNTIIESFEP